MEPTEEQVKVIRERIQEEELRELLLDTIEQLQRLGDRLESYVNDKITGTVDEWNPSPPETK